MSFTTGAGYVTLAAHESKVLLMEMFAGHDMVGSSVSRTRTEKVQLLDRLDVSVVTYVTFVRPRLKADPLPSPAYRVVV